MGKSKLTIKGVLQTPLKKIFNEKGNLFHIIRNFDNGFNGFGEVYISTVKYEVVKAWKKHFKMTSNFVVPVGKIKLVIFDDRENSTTKGMLNEFILSVDNYYRLTIPPNLWYGFKGLDEGLNMLINVANIPHDPLEQTNETLSYLNYKW